MSTDVTIECICPDNRHESDVVRLRDKLSFRDVIAIRDEIAIAKESEPDLTGADMLAILTESYLIRGIESWTCERDGPKGKAEPIPPSRAAIQELLLERFELALLVSDAADALYSTAVVLPLTKWGATSSRNSSITESTSRSTVSQIAPRKPSKRSSITTTPTDDIATTTTSPDGDSNTLPNSVSAA